MTDAEGWDLARWKPARLFNSFIFNLHWCTKLVHAEETASHKSAWQQKASKNQSEGKTRGHAMAPLCFAGDINHIFIIFFIQMHEFDGFFSSNKINRFLFLAAGVSCNFILFSKILSNFLFCFFTQIMHLNCAYCHHAEYRSFWTIRELLKWV